MNRLVSCFFTLLFCCGSAPAQDRPNVLWLYVEDMCDWLGCYGDELATTPTLDALADRVLGDRYDEQGMSIIEA